MPTAVGTVMLLCLLPVGTMITGSIIVTFFQPGPRLTSAMQHFAAGIVLAAVAIELAPQLAIRIHGQSGVFTIAMLLGFFFAIGVLMLISRYFDADDDEDEGKKDDEVVKKKEPEIFTSNPVIAAVSTPTSAINLDIGSNKTTSTAYSSPVASPRSPMGSPSSLDVNSVNVAMPGAAPGETDGRWNNNQQPGYGNNNNNNWNNNNNNNWNNNNNNGRNRDESFPSQVDHIQYGARGTMDSGYGNRGTMDGGYGNRGTMDGGYGGGYGRQSTIGEGSDVSASSYSNNSQAPLTRAPNSSLSNMGRGNMAGAPPRYGGNQGGYGNNGGYNNNGNNYGRAPHPPPPGPPSMPEPEGDWNGNNNWNNNNGGGYGNNNWNNNMYNNQRGENMYNNQNWNTRTRQRGQSQHTWQPRVRYASQWKNQGRSDMGYVPPPPPRRNGGGNQWGNSVNGNQWNNGQNWNNTNRTMDQTHARMPSYMLHGSATTGFAKSMARNSFKASAPPTIATSGPTSFINTDLTKKPAAAPVGAFNIPWGLIVAVAVDASTDGILIGIASAVGQGGIIIAIALSIEMSFLGISTSVEMNEMNVPKNIQIPLLMVLPGFILVGGAIGATVMAGVGGALFVSFLAFGTAALLFLVVEELLISAHEDLAHDTWYVSICLFVGFMIVLIMDQFSGPNMCIDSINAAFLALNLDENGKQIPGKAILTMP